MYVSTSLTVYTVYVKQTVVISRCSSISVDLFGRVHESDGAGLAQWSLLLLQLRPLTDRTPLHPARGTPLLHQVLRDPLRQHLRGVQDAHRHRLESKFGMTSALLLSFESSPDHITCLPSDCVAA